MITYNRQHIRLYVDGVLEASVAETRAPSLTSYGLYIGTHSHDTTTIVYGADTTFSGYLTDVRLYNYALNTGDVTSLYQGLTNGLFTGDCNSSVYRTHPLAGEICSDGVDNDCDGSVDEGTTSTYYLDTDGDGYSTGATATLCDPATVGMVSYWSFDASTGRDDSGNGNTGSVLNGVAFATGQRGKMAVFDGSDDYIDIADNPSLSPTKAITVAARVNLDTIANV